jgi:hypothetical protein
MNQTFGDRKGPNSGVNAHAQNEAKVIRTRTENEAKKMYQCGYVDTVLFNENS